MKGLDSILLVDDDGIANHLHERLIRKLKIARQVFTKTNGREALKFIEERYYSSRTLPSLILLDISMPVMDGIDFMKEICNSNLLYVKRIPIAILSNSVHAEDVRRVNEVRPCFYITKPLTEAKLNTIIENTLVKAVN